MAAREALASRLVDSLLHDVRNPLNALSINLDVLIEKIKREAGGEVPAGQQKNLKAMRDQIFRVDAVLRQFADFLSSLPRTEPTPDLSGLVATTLTVLGHECRRQMVRVRQLIEPDLKVRGEPEQLRFVTLQVLFRAVLRAGEQGEVEVTLQRDEGRAVLRVRDSSTGQDEPFGLAGEALEAQCAAIGAQVVVAGPEVVVGVPLASSSG
jgi:signal transduction histidine kinase